MAYTFNVEEMRTNRTIGFQSSQDNVSVSWQNEYQVIVGTNASDDIAAVSPYDVITASGLPVVNRSVYYFASKVIPFAICRNLSASQDPSAVAKWTVKAQYKSFNRNQNQDDNEPIAPPAALTDLGTSEEADLEEFEQVLYEDKSSTPKAIRLPSGAFFSDPVMERIPTLTVKLTQYESSITYEQMLARKFKTNDATYRSQPAGTWLIEDVEASTVQVQLSGGATTAALVTYTLKHSPRTDAAGTDIGWKVSRALYDYKYKNGSGTYVWNFDGDQQAATLTRVQSDGTRKTTGTLPDYLYFQVYDETDFSAFLQA